MRAEFSMDVVPVGCFYIRAQYAARIICHEHEARGMGKTKKGKWMRNNRHCPNVERRTSIYLTIGHDGGPPMNADSRPVIFYGFLCLRKQNIGDTAASVTVQTIHDTKQSRRASIEIKTQREKLEITES